MGPIDTQHNSASAVPAPWDTRWLEAYYGFLTDVRLATMSEGSVLIAGPKDRAVNVARAIVRDDLRCDGAPVRVCDGTTDEPLLAIERAASIPAAVLIVGEVHALGRDAQARLLDLARVRSEGGLRRVIATSSASLLEHVYNGAFDDELFYTLNTVHVVIPRLTSLPSAPRGK